MQFFTVLASLLAVAAAMPAAPVSTEGEYEIERRDPKTGVMQNLDPRDQGLRGCILGAISCQYGSAGRCARICGSGGQISSICSCPDTMNGAPYTGAGCINFFTALGRHSC